MVLMTNGVHIWNVGQPTDDLIDMIHSIKVIIAYGDELTYILTNISGIPQPINKARSFTWYGDIVRTIILNL